MDCWSRTACDGSSLGSSLTYPRISSVSWCFCDSENVSFNTPSGLFRVLELHVTQNTLEVTRAANSWDCSISLANWQEARFQWQVKYQDNDPSALIRLTQPINRAVQYICAKERLLNEWEAEESITAPEHWDVPLLLIWAKQTGRAGLIYMFSLQPLQIHFKFAGQWKTRSFWIAAFCR